MPPAAARSMPELPVPRQQPRDQPRLIRRIRATHDLGALAVAAHLAWPSLTTRLAVAPAPLGRRRTRFVRRADIHGNDLLFSIRSWSPGPRPGRSAASSSWARGHRARPLPASFAHWPDSAVPRRSQSYWLSIHVTAMATWRPEIFFVAAVLGVVYLAAEPVRQARISAGQARRAAGSCSRAADYRATSRPAYLPGHRVQDFVWTSARPSLKARSRTDRPGKAYWSRTGRETWAAFIAPVGSTRPSCARATAKLATVTSPSVHWLRRSLTFRRHW